jgi:hypothetical protein
MVVITRMICALHEIDVMLSVLLIAICEGYIICYMYFTCFYISLLVIPTYAPLAVGSSMLPE